MIRVYFEISDIFESKILTRSLDSYKRYNKIDSKNNYIGALGEIVFNKLLIKHEADFTWIPFLKENKGTLEPDFILNKSSVDVKSTYSDSMWFQYPIHNIYVYIRFYHGCKYADIYSYATRDLLINEIQSGVARKVDRVQFNKNRTDYVIDVKYMRPIEELLEQREEHDNKGENRQIY